MQCKNKNKAVSRAEGIARAVRHTYLLLSFAAVSVLGIAQVHGPDGLAADIPRVPAVTPGDVPVTPALPAAVKAVKEKEPGIEWRKLERSALLFLGVMHSFRWATEDGTRAGGIGLGSAYTRSVGNLHGWADGDPFYVNYVGHPMQGAVSGRLFLLADRRSGRQEGILYWITYRGCDRSISNGSGGRYDPDTRSRQHFATGTGDSRSARNQGRFRH